MIELKEAGKIEMPKILIIGAGGSGNNAVNRMINAGVKGVSFATINTDKFVLDKTLTDQRIQIGQKLLKGYGAGADPELGESAAMENEEEIRNLVAESSMVIVTCGMGGGTGTGAAPVIAKICKEAEILTLGVVTLPFSFEGTARMTVAKRGIEKLREWVDTMLVIPNDKLLGISGKSLMLDEAFEMADSVLKNTIESITNIVYNDGEINTDFNDLKTTFIGKGEGHLGVGIVGADGTVLEAAKMAVNSPLLDTNIEGAEVLLVNTCGRIDIQSVNEAISYLGDLAGEDTKVIWGTVHGADLEEDKIMVTIIATGMNKRKDIKVKSSKNEMTQKEPELSFIKPDVVPKFHTTKKLEIPDFLKAYSITK